MCGAPYGSLFVCNKIKQRNLTPVITKDKQKNRKKPQRKKKTGAAWRCGTAAWKDGERRHAQGGYVCEMGEKKTANPRGALSQLPHLS